jgi:hypothetical protein
VKNSVENLEILKKLSPEKSSFIIKLVDTLIRKIIDEAQFIVYKNDIKKIKDIDRLLDENILKLLEEYFDVNILFLDSKTRMPLRIESESDNSYSIIILKFEKENKYEPVYRMIKRDKFQRKFPNSSLLIKNFYELSNNKEDETDGVYLPVEI